MSDAAADPRVRAHRAFGLVVVGMSVAVWWPAFTLGAWGELFFDQLLTVWVAATAALVVVLFQPRAIRGRWRRAAALCIPSLWLVLVLADDPATSDLFTDIVELVGIFVGIIGIPFTLWTLVRVLWPDLFDELSRRARWGVTAVIAVVVVLSWMLGAAQSRYLTCEDFEVSGNSDPIGCVHESPAPTPER